MPLHTVFETCRFYIFNISEKVQPEILSVFPVCVQRSVRFQHERALAHFCREVWHLDTMFATAITKIAVCRLFIVWIFKRIRFYEFPVISPENLRGRIFEATGCVRDEPAIFWECEDLHAAPVYFPVTLCAWQEFWTTTISLLFKNKIL